MKNIQSLTAQNKVIFGLFFQNKHDSYVLDCHSSFKLLQS